MGTSKAIQTSVGGVAGLRRGAPWDIERPLAGKPRSSAALVGRLWYPVLRKIDTVWKPRVNRVVAGDRLA